MSDKIVVPTLGESVTEATVSKWLKSQGEKVSSDEPLVELETDKVNVEVPSPSSGILEKISVKEGETVNVGSLLGTISKKDTVAKPKEPSGEKKYTPPKNIKEHSQKEVIKEAPLVLNNIEEKNEKIIHEAKPLVLDQIHKVLLFFSISQKMFLQLT